MEFDNEEDPEATVIRVSGQDKSDLLMALTGAFNSLDLRVCSASISSMDNGAVMDVFHVTDSHDEKVIASMMPYCRLSVRLFITAVARFPYFNIASFCEAPFMIRQTVTFRRSHWHCGVKHPLGDPVAGWVRSVGASAL